MKKSDLLLAGAMLFGFSATAQAQEQLFFFGFEDGVASFTDSANAPDSITQVQFYDHVGSNGAGLKPEEWKLGPLYDTTMLVLNGLSPYVDRGDTYDIVLDPDGQHKGEFEAMGAQGGDRYFKYMAGGELGAAACEDYRANLFVRALPIDDYTSYRLSMYVKASASEGQMNIDLLRGFYNSEKQFSMTGEQNSGEFKLVKNDFTTDRWERVTMMSYYQNDSVANRYMYQQGYWWSSSWKAIVPGDDTEYNMIVQPDQYFVRLAFTGPGVTYYVDDMALTKSWIGGAEYYQNIMRVDFGYETNLAELANATPQKAIKLPTEYFKISGTDNYTGDYYDEIPVSAAEYHSDGYLYMWIDEEESFDYYEDVKVSFTNPEDEKLQLKYNGDLYPMALDTNWVKAGKIVPDFAGEPAFFNPSVTALSMEQMPPVYQSSEPEDGSFNLDGSMSSFDVTFNKNIFVKVGQYDPADTTSVIAVMRAGGSQEIWVPTAYNAETYTVTFSRQEANTSTLAGDYEFDIVQARATARTPQAEKKTIALSFGEAGTAPHYYLEDPLSAKDENGNLLNAEQSVPLGFMKKDATSEKIGDGLASASESRMYYFGEGGEFIYGMYFSPRGGSNDAYLNYGAVDGYELTLPAEPVVVSFKICGWQSAKPDVKFYVYKKGETKAEAILSETIESNVGFNDNDVITGATSCRFVVEIPEAGDYVLEWSHESSSWDGSVLGDLKVSNVFSAAYQYIQAYNEALASAQGTIASAEANDIYSGEYLNTFKATIATKEGFKSTSPTAYNNIVAEIKAATAEMSARITNVDNYYKAYQAALDMDTLYKDSVGYNELVAFAAVKKAIADYAELDVTVKNNDDLNAITAEINGLTKAMNDRCAAIDAFNGNISDADNAFLDGAAFADLAEFKALQDVYNANKDLAVFTVTDEELKAANDAISAAVKSFNGKLNAANTLTAQIKSLAEMADALVTDWGTIDAAALAEQLASEVEDNQALANVYQLAIKAALEAMMADGGIDEAGMDMSMFIQNNNLYTAATNQKVAENEDPLPGWEVSNVRGNAYFGLPWNNQAANAEKPVVNTWLGLDWNSGVTMSQTLNNLPAGLYTIECGFSSKTPQGNLLIEQFDANGELVQSDTCVWEAGSELMGEANLNQAFQFEAQGITTVITADAFSSGSWGGFDKWALTLNEPLKGVDYAAAAVATTDALNNAYTGVGSVAAPSKVQFYNLNGMQVAEPNKGVNIRISTGANGQRTVEKVLVK